MMNRLVFLATFLAFASACDMKKEAAVAPKLKRKTESLSVKTYSAPETGFLANSHLIFAKNDALLVDAQFTRSAARKLATMIRSVDQKLKTIFITHAHPDHYFGLEILAEQFPDVKIVAKQKVVDEIKRTAEGKRVYWKNIYKEDLTDTIIVPKVLEGNQIELGGNQIRILEFGAGESDYSTALYFPTIKTLVSGDILYNGIHLWLADEGGSIDGWLDNIEKIKRIEDLDVILPGHGPQSGPVLFDLNAQYLKRFSKIVEKSESPDQAISELRAAFPDYQLPVIAEMSANLWFKKFGKTLKATPTPTPSSMVYE